MLIYKCRHENYNNECIIKFGDRRSYIYNGVKSIKEVSKYNVENVNSISDIVPINQKSDSALNRYIIAYNSDRYCTISGCSEKSMLSIGIHSASISLDGKVLKVRHKNILS